MITFPNAKINLGLNILEKRSDGFHNIETIFYPVGLSDILEILPCPDTSKSSSLTITGKAIQGSVSENLCFKVYNILKNDFNIPSATMFLHKIIPVGSGLGGGSSDAAFTVKLLNTLFNIGLDEVQMINYASKIGSDCAFFIKNRPCFATGRGDMLEDIKLNLNAYFILLICPEIHVSTAWAYSQIKPAKHITPLKNILSLPVEQWKILVKNDFEKIVFKKYPELKKIKEQLYEMGAVFASMSGSGSAIYGLFKEKPEVKGLFKENYYFEKFLSF
ncbi:MAG: 4-(cytidine 5'-diphospho)-2-C-methyl-D-erythritol kinase [Bacteroidia bacterium]|nr:4-(cytidine 5'-diphospho)-2-C-methyl-D-erythritol kinase [Bacteroidia bacterium]